MRAKSFKILTIRIVLTTIVENGLIIDADKNIEVPESGSLRAIDNVP